MEICLSSENVTELAKSMICVQQELVPALKDGVNDYTGSSYATLKSVMEVSRAILLSQGIWLTQYPVPASNGNLGLVTKIVHAASGQWQSSLIEMPLSKVDPQGYGSAITYARRYGLSALIGIITEDDDAEGAMVRDRQPATVSNEGKSSSNKNSTQLPKLDGVKYRVAKDENGDELVVAHGNTRPKKEFLKNSGFRWNNQDKVWWRYSNAA